MIWAYPYLGNLCIYTEMKRFITAHKCIHYPGKRPQTVWGCGGIMYDNVNDVEDNEVQDDNVEDDEVEDDDVEVDDENEDGNEEDEVEDVKVEDDVEKEEDDDVEEDDEKVDNVAENEVEDDDVAEDEAEVDDVEDDEVKGEEVLMLRMMMRRRKMMMLRGMMLRSKTDPKTGTTLCASLRRRNARQHCSRAILCGSLQEMPGPKSATNTLCEPAQSKCTEDVSQKPFFARIYK